MTEMHPQSIQNTLTEMQGRKKQKSHIFARHRQLFKLRRAIKRGKSKVHSDIIDAATQDMKIQTTEASLNVELIKNAQKNARRANNMSQDTQYDVYEVGKDIDLTVPAPAAAANETTLCCQKCPKKKTLKNMNLVTTI